MDEVVLQAKKRDLIGKAVKSLRREGGLPAILYGSTIDPIPVTLDYRDVAKVMQEITSSQLILVDVDGEEHRALVRDRQRDPVRGNLIHVDFMVVSMTEKLRTDVRIEFVGEAPAVKEFAAVTVTGTEHLDVECLPQYLPERITVDISSLEEIGDSLYVRDIELPEEIHVYNDPDELIVQVSFVAEEVLPEEEEEEEEELLEEAAGEPEVIERGKREEEAGEEAEEEEA
jgi:large subunit ribosomal protein L25